MKLGEFIEKFSHNNVIRLVYKHKGGHQIVHQDWNVVSMDHEVLKGKSINRHYINNEVLGLATISFVSGSDMHYPEALNIVIEDLGDSQPYLEEPVEENQEYSEAI